MTLNLSGRRLPTIEEQVAELPRPPAVPMITGVFSFPFYWQSLVVWGLLAVGFTVCALGYLAAYVVAMAMLDAGVSVALGVSLIFTLVASFASASFVAVIEETAHGGDVVNEWPSGFWRDWFWTLPTTVGLLVPPVVLLYLVRRALPGGGWLLAVPPAFLVYPFVLASALDNGSPLAAFSKNVFRSLTSVWWSWAIVVVVSMAMVAAWAAAFVSAFDFQPWVTVIVLVPLLPGMMLLYARLIGRLLLCAQMQDEWEDG